MSGGKGYGRWWRPNSLVALNASELPTGARLEYARVAGGKLSARWEAGEATHLAGVVGMYPRTGVEPFDVQAAAAVMNTRVGTVYLRTLTSGLNFNPGYCARIPLPSPVDSQRVAVASFAALQLVLAAYTPVYLMDVARASSDHAARIDAIRHALEVWMEQLLLPSYQLDGGRDLDEFVPPPPGWHPLIVGYDRLPEPPEGIAIPDGLAAFLDTLEHRELSAAGLTAVKDRLRRLYEAGPGAKEDEEPSRDGGDDEEGAALGARIPIPTETFLEELAAKMELHPITVHWLLEELRAEGVVCPPEERREREDYVSVTLLRMLGYRWPEQDAHEAEHGPLIDPDLVDADGIIPLVPCADEPVAAERVRTRLERQLGVDGAERFLADFKRYTRRELPDWIERDFFKRHARQFKNRPIAWHLRSSAGAFSALVLYHRLSRGTLGTLRTTYAGGRIARLRAEQERARGRGQANLVSDLQVAIEDVEAFRAKLEAIERGDTLADRIRCRWKESDRDGRPGPYAPDIDDGVKVNIRPFQEQGLLAAKVIAKW
jgi:hypothetical protein